MYSWSGGTFCDFKSRAGNNGKSKFIFFVRSFLKSKNCIISKTNGTLGVFSKPQQSNYLKISCEASRVIQAVPFLEFLQTPFDKNIFRFVLLLPSVIEMEYFGTDDGNRQSHEEK